MISGPVLGGFICGVTAACLAFVCFLRNAATREEETASLGGAPVTLRQKIAADTLRLAHENEEFAKTLEIYRELFPDIPYARKALDMRAERLRIQKEEKP